MKRIRLLDGIRDDSTQVLLRAWEPVSRTRGGLFATDTFRALGAVFHGFVGERISLRAAALTFVSIFSLVPILTVSLGIMQQLHQEEFHQRLRTFVRDVLAPGVRPESAALLEHFLTFASSAQAGSVGALMLMVSAGMLLHNLDASLHEIWRVRRRRPFAISVCLYALVLTLGPLLLASSLVGTALVKSSLVQLNLPHLQYFTTAAASVAAIGACTLLYKFAPNAPVRFRSALAGGLVAGGAWQLARSVYGAVAMVSFRFNPTYASLGAAPLFLVWIYLSWLIFLTGARLSYAVEHARMRGVLSELGTHPRARELIATRLAQIITATFERGLQAPNVKDLSRALRIPAQILDEILELLVAASLLVHSGRRRGFIPGREPSRLTLADLSAAVGGSAKLRREPSPLLKGSEYEGVEALFSAADDASLARLQSVTWSHIANRLEVAGSLTFEQDEAAPGA